MRLVDPIDSELNRVGDVFHATLNAPLVQDGEVVIPSGSDLQGHLVDVKSAGKFAGKSVVVLQAGQHFVGRPNLQYPDRSVHPRRQFPWQEHG